MKAGAIFDMDGTLLDTEQLYRETWVELAVDYGLVPDPAFPRHVAGTSGAHMYEVVRQHYPSVNAEEFAHACIDRVKNKVAEAVPIKAGMRELLEYFAQKNVKMAVASSSSVEQIEKNMQLAGVRQYFSAIAGGSEVVYGKPEPDIFLLAADRLGIQPWNCYVFEDGINGVKAGVAAGCTTVMIPDGNDANEEMYRICEGVYNDLHEVKKALEAGEL